MKEIIVVLVISIAIVLLIGCTAEKCESWGWGFDECVPFSPLAQPEPTSTPVCIPKFKTNCDWSGCNYEMVWNCQ